MHTLLQHTITKYIDTKPTYSSATTSYRFYFSIHMHATQQAQRKATQHNSLWSPVFRSSYSRCAFIKVELWRRGKKKRTPWKGKKGEGDLLRFRTVCHSLETLIKNPQQVTMGWCKEKKKEKKKAIPYGPLGWIQCRSDLAPLLGVCNHRFPLPSLTSPH